MPHADFIHLRVHSAYSLSEGAIKTKELIGVCKKMQMPAVAVTDTGNLFGALEFALAATDAGIQPIIGTILAIARTEVETGARVGGPAIADPDCLVLLAQDERGYENLMALTSRAYLETEQGLAPQLSLEALEGYTDGLIALTGGPKGPVGRLLLAEHPDRALATLRSLKALFPDRLYVELMRHGQEDEDRIEAALIDFAYAENVPLVATNDCFFTTEDMYEAHDALLCIAEGTYVVEANRRRVTRDHRFRPAEEMRQLFADLPEAVDNTVVIARRCAVMPKKRAPILPTFPSAAGRTEAEELRAQAKEGLTARLEAHVYTPEMGEAERAAALETYTARLDYELDVIEKMGFPGYFLIVADFIKWSKANDIPVGPGRGSGAGSVVAWVLTITDLDPLRFGLLFERFLNPERVSMPDFDIDFCQDRRDEVITYVRDKYGHDRVAQIITFGKLQARAVLRDVGRVLQMPYGQVDRICKLVPNNPANPVTLSQAIDGEPALQQERDNDERVRHLIDLAMKLEGLYRHASTHAAGVVIGDRPLQELVALYRDPRSPVPATQFNMKYVEQAGLVKFDFLGLTTLTVLDVAAKLVRRRGIAIDLLKIP
ncbi:MAG TPA: DNA polymerase III subunit alpha, partial [Inquilinus sp.]|nr:DNA polymerase III subunit alpha [Inquilinus sp.]